jgi:drug/metabolite transporter (DMT)-like permease
LSLSSSSNQSINSTAWTIDAEAKALRHVSASTAALIYSSEPLWGAALAALLLGERLEGAKGWIGASLVVGSSLVAQVGGAAGKNGKGKEKEKSE